MTRLDLEVNATRILAWGSFLITIAVTSWMSTEPVNYFKLVLLSLTALALLASLVIPNLKSEYSKNKSIYLVIFGFIVVASLASISSSDPFSQNFYGVYGRNTGLLTYISLAILLLASMQITRSSGVGKIIRFFFYALVFNVFYCLAVILGFDIFRWNNVFGVPLGTFGNPNFVGAFLGFGVSAIFALICIQGLSLQKRLLLLLAMLLIGFEILETNAVQGIIVSAIGMSFVFWNFLRSRFQNRRVNDIYLGFIGVTGLFSLLGALQIGPLAELIFKQSVSLRGIYWNAGINTGLENFWLGAGMDSYGTWFRRSRDIAKLGPDTITNSAHNVFIDIFSSGGVFLLISYLFLILYIVFRIVRHVLQNRVYDVRFIIVSTVWICYQAQSLISINQIGIAIWGWIFGGLVIGATRQDIGQGIKDQSHIVKKKRDKRTQTTEISGATVLLSVAGGVVGAIIASPPFLADANWRNAISSKDATVVESALLRWPTDPVRISNGLKLFLENQIYDKAYELAKLGTLNFPNDYYSWYNLGILPSISPQEKREIDFQLSRLDPNNPKRPW
jgi:O-antigen ligase